MWNNQRLSYFYTLIISRLTFKYVLQLSISQNYSIDYTIAF